MQKTPVELYIEEDPFEDVRFCFRAVLVRPDPAKLSIREDVIEACGATIDGASRRFSRAVREWKDNQETLENGQ